MRDDAGIFPSYTKALNRNSLLGGTDYLDAFENIVGQKKIKTVCKMEKEAVICVKSRAVTRIIHTERVGNSYKRPLSRINKIEVFVNIPNRCLVKNMRTHHETAGLGKRVLDDKDVFHNK